MDDKGSGNLLSHEDWVNDNGQGSVVNVSQYVDPYTLRTTYRIDGRDLKIPLSTLDRPVVYVGPADHVLWLLEHYGNRNPSITGDLGLRPWRGGKDNPNGLHPEDAEIIRLLTAKRIGVASPAGAAPYLVGTKISTGVNGPQLPDDTWTDAMVEQSIQRNGLETVIPPGKREQRLRDLKIALNGRLAAKGVIYPVDLTTAAQKPSASSGVAA